MKLNLKRNVIVLLLGARLPGVYTPGTRLFAASIDTFTPQTEYIDHYTTHVLNRVSELQEATTSTVGSGART
ncbi:hypothetical protein BDV93DRAFT_132073 [Ceratobasidium sp. AG-I]|nr:hypothetical protein BDV93DRAFT_132073 [Ceratobasidium sp. AG-I]